VGDKLDVPDDMHGVVKFIGIVNGKKGTFAGVQLSRDYASGRKNDGEVDR
jgi:dynactin complex subunit